MQFIQAHQIRASIYVLLRLPDDQLVDAFITHFPFRLSLHNDPYKKHKIWNSCIVYTNKTAIYDIKIFSHMFCYMLQIHGICFYNLWTP